MTEEKKIHHYLRELQKLEETQEKYGKEMYEKQNELNVLKTHLLDSYERQDELLAELDTWVGSFPEAQRIELRNKITFHYNSQ